MVASASLSFIDVQPEDLPEVERIAFKGYLQGLREAGWLGNMSLRAWVIRHRSPCGLARYSVGSKMRRQRKMGGRTFALSILSRFEEVADRIRGYAASR